MLSEITEVKPLAQGCGTQYVPQMLGITATTQCNFIYQSFRYLTKLR